MPTKYRREYGQQELVETWGKVLVTSGYIDYNQHMSDGKKLVPAGILKNRSFKHKDVAEIERKKPSGWIISIHDNSKPV